MSSSEYIQIGGFGAQTNPWCTVTTEKGDVYRDNDTLAKIICGPMSPLMTQTRGADQEVKAELILGIIPSGASYLLMTYEQMLDIARKSNLHHLRPRRYPSDFISLSPIEFRSVEELEKKLGRYTPKSKNKLKGIDCSPANNRFVISGGERPGRGEFEHARVFYRLLKSALDPKKFGVISDSWVRSIGIISFVFNVWDTDIRPSKERFLRPRVLDIGWSEVGVPDLNIKDGTSTHIVLAENRMFGLKGRKKSDFDHGTTEMVNHGNISQRLEQLLGNTRGSKDRPIVLLVNHAEATLNMLKYFGVDTSNFVLGIKSLLHASDRTHSSETSERRSQSPRRRDDYHYYSSRRRTPPPNSVVSSHSHPEYDLRDRTVMSSYQYPPVYVVDIRTMIQNVMDSGDLNAYSSDKLDTLAGILHIHYPLNGWCAGNESWELVILWKSMAEGLAIDEQRAMREKAEVIAPIPGPSHRGLENDDDDPNDYTPAGTSGLTGGVGYGAFDDVWDDDEED